MINSFRIMHTYFTDIHSEADQYPKKCFSHALPSVRWMVKSGMLLLPFLVFPLSLSLSPFPPEDGDVRHLYPQSSIAFLIGSHSHLLPYLLGWIENVDYPKKRLHLGIYLTPDAKEDSTKEQIQWWIGQTAPLFKSLSLHETTKMEGKEWEEDALNNARQKQSSFLLFWKADDLPSNSQFLTKIFHKSRPVVSSILLSPPSHRGLWNIDLTPDLLKIKSGAQLTEISRVSFPFVLNLDKMDSAYLTFEEGNIRGYEGKGSPSEVFEFSARVMSIPLFLDRSLPIGWHFHPRLPIDERRMSLRYLLADQIVDFASISIPQSRSVRAPLPLKKKFGFEKIMVINLRRRPERRKIMEGICDVIGIECEFVEATDGRSLPSSYPLTQLESFLDPSSKRKMTNGEVGCFLSHYRIWESVVADGLSRVLVMEDDARLVDGAFKMMGEMMEDMMKERTQWGLVYMGRKRTPEHIKKDVWVSGVRHLSTVGYSYWTVGYALSLEGAKSLLSGNPLERMLPVDEYLPIMANVHPNEEWMNAFENRSLRMFTIHPLVIYPHRYTNEKGHLSDTEKSEIYEEKSKEEL
ncbi:hypothetical protein PMAYCL1PPCAC_12709 [Pristionchus mayeri]|uniref:Glycosyl transferase family 25 domain-containing protein n=1 Tax=Pristionchus mayeri TaxID=1317129 RepID=A0AAN5CG74_9BILA|nr:hypothetical protein PMAYCL1PPCAC_12709 [Pristionchus mayeri]